MDMLHAVNNRLYDSPYIKSVADHTYFHELRDRIRKLGYEGSLPDVLGQGAWKKSWDIYQDELRKPAPKPQPASGVDHYALLLSTAKHLVDARRFIQNVISRSGLGEARCLDLLGLKPEDLAYTDWPAKFVDACSLTWNQDREAVYALSKRLQPVERELRPKTDIQLELYFAERRLHLVEQRITAPEGQKGN